MQNKNQKSKKSKSKKPHELRIEVFKLKTEMTQVLNIMDELFNSMNMLRFMTAQGVAAIELLKEKGIVTDGEINEKIQATIKSNIDSGNPKGSDVQPEETITGNASDSGDSFKQPEVSGGEDSRIGENDSHDKQDGLPAEHQDTPVNDPS